MNLNKIIKVIINHIDRSELATAVQVIGGGGAKVLRCT